MPARNACTHARTRARTHARTHVHTHAGGAKRPSSRLVAVSTPGYHKAMELFRLMGHLTAKAILDGRNLPLPLSRPFLKLVRGWWRDLQP